jgi:transcriptional regulator with XRE-family HTH domain
MGGRLKRARRRAGLTQVSLAGATGVGLATIRRVEQADAEPRVATARRLAQALGVRVEWLLFGVGEAEAADDGSATEARA